VNDTNDEGIDGKDIALEGKSIENLDIAKSYNTIDGGKFTFTIPGNVLGESTSHIPKPPVGEASVAPDKQQVDDNSGNLQVHFKGDGQYSETSEAVIIPVQGDNTTAVVPRLQVQDVVIEERANEKPAETKLPIPGPDSLQGCKFDHISPVRGDKYNEIEQRGTDLIYKAREKGKSKIFEYSIFYNCPDPTQPPPIGPIIDPGVPQVPTPGAPVIKSPTPGTQKTPIILISGNAETGTSVEVFDGSKSLGTVLTKTDPDGNWWSLSTQLGDGTYSFTAKATDKIGNTGESSAAVGVVVDTTAPDTEIKSATDGNNKAIVSDGFSNSKSITFSFVGAPVSDTDHFVCSINGVANINPCVSPKQFTALPPGNPDPDGDVWYTFTVGAVDPIGNEDQTPAKFKWVYMPPPPPPPTCGPDEHLENGVVCVKNPVPVG
jgi:hypothetical protein